MSFDRRKFVQNITALIGGSTLLNPLIESSVKEALHHINDLSDEEVASAEGFWKKIRDAYSVSSKIINLNNGGVSPQPTVVQQAVEEFNRLSNDIPSYYMWRVLDKGKEPLRKKLAMLGDCSHEEIAINRNASEALETVIFGLQLKKGDEVILSKHDYPSMINAYKQRAHRDGIVLKWVSLDLPCENKEEIVQKYQEQITSKTKLMHITHVINWMGQILPAKELVAVAKSANVETIIDAAHSFCHFEFSIREIDCDYLGTSLHKWLSAPFGTGMLFVKKTKIRNVYPLLAFNDPKSDKIKKFEALGTRSIAIEQGINQAITFHDKIGIKRKQQRLHHLKNYWLNKVKDLPRVNIHTSQKPEFSCAIANFSIDGIKPIPLHELLYDKYFIHTSPAVWENISSVRVTPNTYTLKTELDKLVIAIKEISASH